MRAAEVPARACYPKFFFALDAAQENRTTVGNKNPRLRAVFTTALLGLAPASSTRASAVNHRKSISASRRDDLGD